MAVIELTLSHPPSANHLWKMARGHVYKSPIYQRWLVEAGWLVRAQHPGKIDGPYKMMISAVRPDRRRRDASNLIKATEDLLVSLGVTPDDSFCEMITARWVTSGEGVTVRIEPAGVEA